MPRDIPQLKGFSEQSHWEESRESGPEAQQHQGKDDDEFVTLNHDDVGSYSDFFRRPPMNDKTNQRDRLHPFVQTLSISNVEDCVRVEEGAFPEHERCSREKVRRYQISLFEIPMPLPSLFPMLLMPFWS